MGKTGGLKVLSRSKFDVFIQERVTEQYSGQKHQKCRIFINLRNNKSIRCTKKF